jgi:hypothetical protein
LPTAEQFSTRGYVSDTHGGRFVHNAANDLAAEEYGKYEEVRRMPVGSILAKPSFTVAPDGRASLSGRDWIQWSGGGHWIDLRPRHFAGRRRSLSNVLRFLAAVSSRTRRGEKP